MNIPCQEYFILSDPQKITKIVSQLVGNALKFTREGQVEITIGLDNGNLQITISDTGIGIPEEKQKFIFEPFRQASEGMSRDYGGNGIGLSIVRAYTKLLGGSVSLKSEINKGTTVIVSIPANQIGKQISKQISASSISKHNHSILTILITEDEFSNYEYLRQLLNESRFTIIYAANGKQAVDLCTSDLSIDLVLMDLEMPVMDGLTATKLIKTIRPDLPVIAQTAHALNSENAHYKDDFDDYITKPIRKAELIEKLKKYLELLT